MSDPCDFSISKIENTGDSAVVRIEARDGAKILATIEMSAPDFVSALLDGVSVTAALSITTKGTNP